MPRRSSRRVIDRPAPEAAVFSPSNLRSPEERPPRRPRADPGRDENAVVVITWTFVSWARRSDRDAATRDPALDRSAVDGRC
jgi:hypothetical protein